MDIRTQIVELRAELAACDLTKAERSEAKRQLENLLDELRDEVYAAEDAQRPDAHELCRLWQDTNSFAEAA